MASSISMAGPQQAFVSDAVVGSKPIHRVRIGLYDNKGDAVDAMIQICPQLGLTDCWLVQH